MAVELTTHAIEKSTFVIIVAFTDEDGDAVSPVTANWTLSDGGGTIINSREQVEISSPTSSEDIVLSGDDLALRAGETNLGARILTIEATYNSDLGDGLPLNGSVIFTVDNLIKIS